MRTAAICLASLFIVLSPPTCVGQLTRLTFDSARDWDPSWSPDGQFLAFTRTSPASITSTPSP